MSISGISFIPQIGLLFGETTRPLIVTTGASIANNPTLLIVTLPFDIVTIFP